MDKTKLGIIGLGQRGSGLLNEITQMDDIEIYAVCDSYKDRTEDAFKVIKEKCGNEPIMTQDYRDILKLPEIKAVLISAAWEAHADLAIASMRAGKWTALEVGGAYDISDCHKLVDAYEETKTPFMFLENCCYGRYELMVLDMVRKGLFGKVVHCDGAYAHDLRDEVINGKIGWHYRYSNYLHRNCDNYPTHEIGPIAKILKINHGNRFLKLNSFGSRSYGMHEYIKENHSDDEELMNAEFAQADIVTTVITCANGETVTIKLDTTLPRFYSRDFTVHGTRAMYSELNNALIIEGEYKEEWNHNYWNNAEAALEKYESPIWKQFQEEGVKGGHGGMDGLVYSAFVDAVLGGHDMPIDVYDAATWMVITALTEQSLAAGGAPVAFPDFTLGKWKLDNEPKNPGRYHIY